MTKQNNARRGGFTIIEVVLVLAIAGLIFLMVFIALPALQRSQRNNRRKSDLARISTAVTEYIANNKRTPFAYMDGLSRVAVDSGFVTKYIDETCKMNAGWSYDCETEQFRDPSGKSYSLVCGDDLPSREMNCRFAATTPDYALSEKYSSGSETIGTIRAFVRAKCSEKEGTVTVANGVNEFALIMMLEGGSWYCVDSQ